MTEPIGLLVQNSDPANLGLLAVVWWRLDRRMRKLRSDLSSERSETA